MRALGRSYLQHGSRHGKQGSDPIPSIEGAWALYAGNGDSNVVISDLTYYGIDHWTWGPSDQNPFSLVAGTGSLTGIDVLQVGIPGVYKISPFVSIEGTLGDEFTVGIDGSLANWTATNTQAQDFNKLKIGELDPAEAAHLVTYSQMVFLGGSLSFADTTPWTTVLHIQTFLGNSAFTLDGFELLIELMSSDYGSSLDTVP